MYDSDRNQNVQDQEPAEIIFWILDFNNSNHKHNLKVKLTN